MARKVDLYRAELRRRTRWEPYLTANSGLPGPRGNLELVEAVGDEAEPEALWRWSTSPDEFLAVCGTAGLGRLIHEDRRALVRLRDLASDPRWRVREAVAIALQRLGTEDMPLLLKEMKAWSSGSRYEQRAAAAALCEPRLLKDLRPARQVLGMLDAITTSLAASTDRRADDFRVLRQALGYCWSVAVAADPERGRSMIERWSGSEDRDVRWIMKSNLGKARMSAAGASWVTAMRRITGSPST
jgi:HEAT repeat protein